MGIRTEVFVFSEQELEPSDLVQYYSGYIVIAGFAFEWLRKKDLRYNLGQIDIDSLPNCVYHSVEKPSNFDVVRTFERISAKCDHPIYVIARNEDMFAPIFQIYEGGVCLHGCLVPERREKR